MSASMDVRYTVELRERDPATVEDLILDNCAATKFSGIDDKLVNLQALSAISCGLTSVEGLPVLPALTKLDVSANKIEGDLDIIAKNCPSLLHLNLAGNCIKDLNVFSVFADSQLAELDLFSNEAADQDSDEYRSKLFEMIPSLQILDGCDVNGEEVEDDLSIGESGAGESAGEDSDDEEGVGLSYLDNSQIDEEEGEDYDPKVKRGKKRGPGGDDSEPEAKRA